MRQLGAEVIKIEQPGAGDYMRGMEPSALFHHINHGKKSVALNLKSRTGRGAFLHLAARADVVIEGFRPGVMDRLGCGYSKLEETNPRLIYAALTGYGQTGPWSAMAGHDVNYLAMSGVLDLIGSAGGPPVIPGVQIADLAAGSMQLVIAVLAALLRRTQTGKGAMLDVSMLHGATMLLPLALAQAASGAPPSRGDSLLSGRYACYRVYQARDGRYLAVGALEPKFWAALCQALGCPHYIEQQFAEDPARREVIATLEAAFRTRSAAEWFESLKSIDACVTPVRTLQEAAADLALMQPPAQGPALGEHTRQVLIESGYPDTEAVLAHSGVR
jgi:crotonobetainyl-CoA:carnitine CoA-transferase CaiB-like acyl-CoA transferase